VAQSEEGGHEHVCSDCLQKYHCTNPDDADLEFGLCLKHRPAVAPETTPATPSAKKKGSRKR
jgi:hypothetical protein